MIRDSSSDAEPQYCTGCMDDGVTRFTAANLNSTFHRAQGDHICPTAPHCGDRDGDGNRGLASGDSGRASTRFGQATGTQDSVQSIDCTNSDEAFYLNPNEKQPTTAARARCAGSACFDGTNNTADRDSCCLEKTCENSGNGQAVDCGSNAGRYSIQ